METPHGSAAFLVGVPDIGKKLAGQNDAFIGEILFGKQTVVIVSWRPLSIASLYPRLIPICKAPKINIGDGSLTKSLPSSNTSSASQQNSEHTISKQPWRAACFGSIGACPRPSAHILPSVRIYW
ncbi:hypothetical protein V0R51_25900 [Pseudomonas otitidis]|uniref:hypothetical protein n=1 Tax=Metapseudomonas otitidis TaxID=319939 RepID=UPI002E7AB5DD|nr:hypothetical protein [Pseudomonas otitidis]MEE1896346.1 hypothetical protein [Pseudomonas otitidis]